MRPLVISSLLLLPALTLPAFAQTLPASQPSILTQLAALKPDDTDARLALARAARDRRQWEDAQAAAQSILYNDPGNRAAFLILQQIDEARPLPDEPVREADLQAEFRHRFNRDFKLARTRHFLILHDTDDLFAAARGAALERVYEAFFFYFNMNSLRPAFLQNRLVVVLFQKRDDFLAYMKQTEHQDVSWASGYYSQATNRTAFYDDLTSPAAVDLARQATTLRSKVADLTQKIDATAATRPFDRTTLNGYMIERSHTTQSLTQLTNKLESALKMANQSKTMHEAAHQVAFNTGIQKRGIFYSFWFSEGLASAFEFEDSVGRKGPALINPGRTAILKDLLKSNGLLPVDKLITTTPTEPSALNAYYAEGWALFHYLYKYHRVGMEKYIQAWLLEPPLRRPTPEAARKLFTDAFGQAPEALEPRFFAYLKALPPRSP